MTWLTVKVHDAIRQSHPGVGIVAVPRLAALCRITPAGTHLLLQKHSRGPHGHDHGLPNALHENHGPVAQRLDCGHGAKNRFCGITPFNSHLDQYRELVSGVYNFDAYQVEFPADMPKLLAGPGIHLNGMAARVREPGVLTFLDYVWNPEAYDSTRSLRNAQSCSGKRCSGRRP